MGNNYFKTHPMYKNFIITENKRNIIFNKYLLELNPILNFYDKNIKILEIGFGNGNFSYFCKKYGFKNYIGIDIDDTFIEKNKKEFKNYFFEKQDFQVFLKKSIKYDIVFTSHVFEHLIKNEANELIKGIYTSLNDGGCRINYMPNADSHLNACSLRYHDITHKYLYNTHSFEQIILTNEVSFSKMMNFNSFPFVNKYIRFIFKITHPIFLLITKLYYYGMGCSFPKIYTSEILSILRK